MAANTIHCLSLYINIKSPVAHTYWHVERGRQGVKQFLCIENSQHNRQEKMKGKNLRTKVKKKKEKKKRKRKKKGNKRGKKC